MMDLNGELIITRPQGNMTSDHVSITVTDKASRFPILKAMMSHEAFSRALGSQGQACQIEFYDTAPIGKQREHKSINVLIPSGYQNREENARKAMFEYEVDGWKGRLDDALNHHTAVKMTDDGTYHRVVFTRYTDEEGNPHEF
jgi:hypothetical protein